MGSLTSNNKCIHCQTNKIEYDEPEEWCRFCWCSWWSAGMEPRSDREFMNILEDALSQVPEKKIIDIDVKELVDKWKTKLYSKAKGWLWKND